MWRASTVAGRHMFEPHDVVQGHIHGKLWTACMVGTAWSKLMASGTPRRSKGGDMRAPTWHTKCQELPAKRLLWMAWSDFSGADVSETSAKPQPHHPDTHQGDRHFRTIWPA